MEKTTHFQQYRNDKEKPCAIDAVVDIALEKLATHTHAYVHGQQQPRCA